ncbi:MAG: hypothetical protein DI551_12475 [Micavibrio aeruginosavorus]|uniref:Uncharacterized protein n=1 Tax=Micavibrio aeruginosavorus TaxID=349221 RepID=A0A2W5PFF7_9BACT|nr:MAG: hypothetical protein DI551_12475 [Micavibrio aeruginosavorus]
MTMSSSEAKKKVIHRVLEETRYAYKVSCETDHANADYAEYASQQSLTEFRRAFGNPELTYEQLAQILRGASNKERRRQCKTPWAMFMANYLERNGNSNSVHIHH